MVGQRACTQECLVIKDLEDECWGNLVGAIVDAEITSTDFEWLWKLWSGRIAQVYRLILIGCDTVEVLRFITPKDEYLRRSHRLRGILLGQSAVRGELALSYRLACAELEEVWEGVKPLVGLL